MTSTLLYLYYGNLGFYISTKKSVLIPTKSIQFLGFNLNSQTMLVTLENDKAMRIKQMITDILPMTKTTIRHFATVLGTLAATLPANRYGQVFLKRLEKTKAQALQMKSFNYDAICKIPENAKTELQWWLQNIDVASRPILVPNPSVIMYTDASLQGWGCFLPKNNFRTGGRWDTEEQNYHINFLELKAVLLSLQSCCRNVSNSHIMIYSDNTTTVISINKQGSTQSQNCNDITRDIWLWAKDRNNWLSSAHCPGKFNIEADEASRLFNDSTEWTLTKRQFLRLTSRFGQPVIDMFASRLNFQLQPYCSWQPDPHAKYIDCFTFNWKSHQLIYAFPPFSVVGRVLQKIAADKTTAILVVPHWPTQPWFSRLQEMLIDRPIVIPVACRTLFLPHDRSKIHPLTNKLCLWGCKVSGRAT